MAFMEGVGYIVFLPPMTAAAIASVGTLVIGVSKLPWSKKHLLDRERKWLVRCGAFLIFGSPLFTWYIVQFHFEWLYDLARSYGL